MNLSIVVDVLSVVAVVSGLFFAGIELRHYRLTRDRESVLRLFSTFQTPAFVKGARAIAQLPDNLSKQQVEELAGEQMEYLYFNLASLEGLGALVHKEELSLAVVEDFFSGIIVLTWLKLRRYVDDERKALGRDTWLEWTQWLAERIMDREAVKPAVPAYIEYKDWKATT